MEKSSQGVLQQSDIDNENIVADGLPVSIFSPPLEVLWPSLLFFLIMFFDESLQLRHSLEVTT